MTFLIIWLVLGLISSLAIWRYHVSGGRAMGDEDLFFITFLTCAGMFTLAGLIAVSLSPPVSRKDH